MKNYPMAAKSPLQQLSQSSYHKIGTAFVSLAPKIYLLLLALFCVGLTLLLELPLVSACLLFGVILYYASSRELCGLDSRHHYLVLGFLFIAFVFISKKIVDYRLDTAYFPVPGLVMLIAILFNNLSLSFTACILAACIAGLFCGNSLLMSVIFLTTGIVTALTVRKVRTRIRILGAGACAGLTQALLFWITFPHTQLSGLTMHFYNGIICAIVVAGTLPFFENLFGTITNISLLELSDFNHPLLKRMILDAPGTYHHSLIVGNLAEAAAESIGANALLARIGAYYHDIGKLSGPEYFMENQKASSKHSHLSPSMSKMVIMNHIKEGAELAKKYKLKPALIDFICQHHGTSLVYYFYRKALEETGQFEEVEEEGFRYPGPKPNTKETAIVLLADSVEAASRVISEPQPAKIEEVVHKVINNKFIDGQLDNCELTLKDLEKIASIFIHMLSGIYHGRIKYPEVQKKEAAHKKHIHPSHPSYSKQDKEHHKEGA